MMAKPDPPRRSAGLFGDHRPEAKPSAPAAWRANIDGGSRGNPGLAAYGVVIRNPRGEIVARLKKYIGRTTNNVAEYYGLIAALDFAQSSSVRELHIESDSELLVKQMRGQYKHIYREQNREADALANEAMDEVSAAPRAENGKSKTENGNSPAGSRDAAKSAIRVRARLRSGVLYPLEDIDLPDGTEVEIVLRPAKRD